MKASSFYMLFIKVDLARGNTVLFHVPYHEGLKYKSLSDEKNVKIFTKSGQNLLYSNNSHTAARDQNVTHQSHCLSLLLIGMVCGKLDLCKRNGVV